MELSREILEREIEGAKAAVKAHSEGVLVNQIVLDSFEKLLKEMPPKKEKLQKT